MIRFALIAASTLGFFLTAALGNLMVPLLRAFQGRWDEPKARQTPSPKQEAPDAEPERPPQAPTMGGLCLMVGVLAAVGVGWTAACVAQPELLGAESLLSVRLLTALLGALLFGGVGLLEDLARIRSRSVLGLRRHTRLGLEAAAGAVVLVLLGAKGCLAAGITLPGVGYVDLGIAAPLLWEGLLVALAECARIADGMDGIVCGTSFAAMLGLMGVMTLLGWFPLGVLPAALAGSLMAFLLWNFPPAKLRLGSVGSLFLAGMLGCVPLCIGWPDLTLPLALPFWLEGGMVALQILVCKASRGRRQLFRSAPLHRWLELRGQSAEQIFYTFCVIAMLGVALTVQLAKNQLRRGAVWQHSAEKKAEPFSVFQRDPGPWPPILLNWMATLAIIMVFGLVMLFSASYTTGYLRFGDSFHYIKSQLLCTVLGLGMMFLFSYFDHRFLRRMVKLGYVVCLILLVLVLFSSPINGCRRWISFGGLTLQASEVAKFEMILLTADIAARTPQVKFGELPLRKWVHHSIVVELIRPILWLVPVLILLVLEPHMSGILLTTAIVGTILLLGGSGGIITWGCAGAALFLLETLLKHVDSIDYLQSRLDGWTQDLDRMTSQTKQSLYAIGSGGATGLGLGNSIEKQLWLPESTNDFIFSVVCEELGFVGAVIVIVLFVLFLVQGFWIAFHAENGLHAGGHRHHGADRLAGVLQHRRCHQHPAQHRHFAALLLLRRHQSDPAAGRDGRYGQYRAQR